MQSFSRRVFGGSPDSFRLVLEYGPASAHSYRHYHPEKSHGVQQVRLPVAAARVEFEWTSDDSESEVVERFAQRISAALEDLMEERVMLEIDSEQIDHAASFPNNRLRVKIGTACVAPLLRNVQLKRSSSSGIASEELITALLSHCDVASVWKVKGDEGFGNFWSDSIEAARWASLRNLNLSSCGLMVLPGTIGDIASLKILRVSHNKLASLPPELRSLTNLEVLAADHNTLAALPPELRFCSSLRELHLEGNRLTTPVLDMRALTGLQSLQLWGNPLEYLPELSPCTQLRSLSLANVRILADAGYTRWEVEVSNTSYMSRSHKLAPLFSLIFRRSSCQHPLLAGALGRITEDKANCELIAREEVALQQLVLMAMSENLVVVRHACAVISRLAGDVPTARKLLGHDVNSAIGALVAAGSQDAQMCGLGLLGNLAAASDVVAGELLTPAMMKRLQALAQSPEPLVQRGALEALGNLSFSRANKARVLAAPGLVELLVGLANPRAKDARAERTKKYAVRVLAILGQTEQVAMALGVPPIRGRGIRVLAMDGGGMKGLALVDQLRAIEERAGRPIWQLFDVIGGTSTGAMLAVEVAVLRFSPDTCEHVYTSLGHKVFNQAAQSSKEETSWRESLYRMYKSSSQSMRVAVYGCKHDASTFEELLKDTCQLTKLGAVSERFIDGACFGGPKVFCVATLASVTPAQPFVFRNYELPLEADELARGMRASMGSSRHYVWQAIRASSAAPYYLDDFLCGEDRFQDGAATANNPAVIALQQARLLYPDHPIELLVSLGCGSTPLARRERSLSAYLDTGNVLIESACTVDRTDEALATVLPLVPGIKYFRFNPVDKRCAMELDDVDPSSWALHKAATADYIIANEARFAEVVDILTARGVANTELTGSSSASSSSRPGVGQQQQQRHEKQQEEEEEAGREAERQRQHVERKFGVLLVEAPRLVLGAPQEATEEEASVARVELVARALAHLPGIPTYTLDLSEELLQRQQGGQQGGSEQGSRPGSSLAMMPLGSAGSSRQASDAATISPGLVAMARQQPVTSPRPATAGAGAPGADAATSPAASGQAGEGTPPGAPPGTDASTLSTSASLYDILFNRWSATGPVKSPPADGSAPMPQPSPQLTPQQQQRQAGQAPQQQAIDMPSRYTTLSSPAAAGTSPPLGRSSIPISTLSPPPAPGADAGLLSTSAPATSSMALMQHRRTTGQQPQASLDLCRSPPLPGPMSKPVTPSAAVRRSSTSHSLVADQPLHQLLTLSLRTAAPTVDTDAGPADDLELVRSPAVATPPAGSPTVHPFDDGVQLCYDTSSAAGLLAARLQQLGSEVSVVHLGLHCGQDSLVAGWRHANFAVVEPGRDAGSLLELLGYDPGSTTLSQVCSVGSTVELPDCSLLQLLGRQQLRTRLGHCIESFLFQKTFPGPQLEPSDIYRGIAHWRRKLVVSDGCLPAPVVEALLRCGVQGVLCATRGEVAAGADAGEVAAALEMLYRRLATGQGVAAALADSEALLPSVAGYFRLHQL